MWQKSATAYWELLQTLASRTAGLAFADSLPEIPRDPARQRRAKDFPPKMFPFTLYTAGLEIGG